MLRSMGGAAVLAVFAAGILPCIGFNPMPLRADGYLAQDSCVTPGMAALKPTVWRAPKKYLHRRRTSGKRVLQMAISQSTGGKQGAPPWPAINASTPPLHVKILAGVASDVGSLGSLVPPAGKKTITDYTVQVNDKVRRPLQSGYFPLRAQPGERIDAVSLEGARFALTGDLRLGCPSYVHLLPPVAGESVQRLWITSFGMARSGGVVGVDLTGKLPARKLRTEFVWPNAVEHVAGEWLAPLFSEGFEVTGSILVADGFLVPGKTDGGVFLVQNPGGSKEMSARLTRRDDSRWFYHRYPKAVPMEVEGHKGVLTARALKPLSPFQPAQGQLVWLEVPNASNPVAPWNVPWREVVLADGPDVMFEVVDLDVTDDTVEVFAAEFFAQRLTMHSIKWDEGKGVPYVVQREVIDDSLGQAYSVAVADLEGPSSHLLVTTHEYLPVPLSTMGSGWSYTSEGMVPKEAQEVNGGSLFAYRIPPTWRRRSDGFVPSLESYARMLPDMFARIDVDKSGEISVSELEASLAFLGITVPAEQLRSAFEDADWDGSGTIEYAEFERILLELRRKPDDPLERAAERAADSVRDRLDQLKVRDRLDQLPKMLKQIRAQVDKAMLEEEEAQAAAEAQAEAAAGAASQARGLQGSEEEKAEGSTKTGGSGMNITGVEEILRNAYGDEVLGGKQSRIRDMFDAMDADKDGLLAPHQVRELCITIWKDLNSSRNVWGILSSALESVLARGTPGEAAAQEQQWTRTTLATGFSVKRAGINPGAPGFVYPFYPHKRMRRADTPPHLLVAGDCSDAAYIFRPVLSDTKDGTGAKRDVYVYGPWKETNRQGVQGALSDDANDEQEEEEEGGGEGQGGGGDKTHFLYPGQPPRINPLDFRYPITTGDTGRVRYELMATFGCEGTVGSVAVGNVDTLQSVDDGWVKFFLPIYEKDRVYMLKCGDTPTIGYVDDDDW